MIKPNIDSACSKQGEAMLVCPSCNEKAVMPIFKTQTDLAIGPIKLHSLHDRFFAVCTNCRNSFEAQAWKS